MKGFARRLALRELQRHKGRFLLLVMALAVGFAAFVATTAFATGVLRAVASESRALLGADLVVSSRGLLPPDLPARLQGLTLGGQATVYEFPTMVGASGDRSRLVELRAVAGSYPLAGRLETRPAGGLQGLVVDAALAEAWGLSPAEGPGDPAALLARGQALRLGEGIEPIRGVLVRDDSQQASAFALGPRVYLGLERARDLGLVTSRARLTGRLLVNLAPGAGLAETARRLREAAGPELRVRTHEEAGTALARPLRNLNRFVGLLGLATLLLAGLGGWAILTAFLESRTREVAILRCLGAPPAAPVRAYGLLALALLGAAVLLGGIVGLGGAALLPSLLGDLVPQALRQARPALPAASDLLPVLLAMALLLGPALMTLAAVRPLALLREGPEPGRRLATLVFPLLAALLVGWVVVRQAPSLGVGLATAGALALLLAVLFGLARLLVALYRRLGAGLPLPLRLGLGQLGARPVLSALLMSVMGLAVFLILATHFLKEDLVAPLASQKGDGSRANLFLLDVPPEGGLPEYLAAQSGASVMEASLVRGRLVSVAGRALRPPREGQDGETRQEAFRSREQNLSWRARPSASETVVAGAWWPEDGRPRAEASLEQGFAKAIGAQLGTELVFDVSGQEVRVRVTSLRQVRWTSFQLNFFILMHPSVLEGAPATRLLALEVDEAAVRERLRGEVARRHPGVTVVDVGDLVAKASQVLTLVDRVARILAALMLASALLVLGASLLAGRMGRTRDLAVLRAMGASDRLLLWSLAWEFLVLGGSAALSAGVLAFGAARLYATRVLELDSHPSPLLGLVLMAVAALLTLAVGLAGSRAALRRKPLEVLRSE